MGIRRDDARLERVTELGDSVGSHRIRAESCLGPPEDRTVRVWSVETGKLAFEPIKCRGWSGVFATPQAETGSLRVGHQASRFGTLIRELGILSIRDSAVNSLAWTADGTYVIGGGTGSVTIWNSHNGEQLRTWKAHKRWIRHTLPLTKWNPLGDLPIRQNSLRIRYLNGRASCAALRACRQCQWNCLLAFRAVHCDGMRRQESLLVGSPHNDTTTFSNSLTTSLVLDSS
jgi:WD40 repeat protein